MYMILVANFDGILVFVSTLYLTLPYPSFSTWRPPESTIEVLGCKKEEDEGIKVGVFLHSTAHTHSVIYSFI